MFEDIVDILDPEMNLLEEEDEIPEEDEEAAKEQQSVGEHPPASAHSMADSVRSEWGCAC